MNITMILQGHLAESGCETYHVLSTDSRELCQIRNVQECYHGKWL